MTAPAPPSDDPATGATPALPDPPDALWQYPLYSLRVLRFRRRLGQRLEALDLALREAVQTRDEALAALGEATLAGEARTGRIATFAETLTGLDSERSAIDRRREALTIELAAAEADRRARLAELDARIEGLEAELIPLERALEEHRHRRETLDQETADADDLRQSLQSRRAHIESDHEADETTRALYEKEQAEIEARLAEVSAAEPARLAARTALDGPLARLEGQVAELHEMRQTVTSQRAAWLEEVDSRIAELTANRDEELSSLERSDARRRAALVDLGREALHQEGAERPGADARRALEHIVELRRQRKALQAQDAALDLRPVTITVLTLLAIGLALLFLRGC